MYVLIHMRRHTHTTCLTDLLLHSSTSTPSLQPNVISISPLDEGKKYYYFGNLKEFTAKLPDDHGSKQDFEYIMSDPVSGWTANEKYYAMEERWVGPFSSLLPVI